LRHPTQDHAIETEFTGTYDTIMDPEVRLHAHYWQRTCRLQPAIHRLDGAGIRGSLRGAVGTPSWACLV